MASEDQENQRGALAQTGRVAEAYDTVRHLILSHQLAPGTSIVETQLAGEISHTRVTLRAALQRLEHEGFVHSRSLGTYRRRIVAPLTVVDMEDVFSLIGALEGVAARRVASLGEEGRRRLVTKLEDVNAAMLAELESDSSGAGRASELDAGFHRTLVEEAAGDHIRLSYGAAAPHVERYRNVYAMRIVQQLRTSYDEHHAICASILVGGGVESQLVVERHWENAADRLRNVITEMGERGAILPADG